MQDVLLDAAAVAQLTGLSKSTLAKWRVAGRGPQFKKIGSRVLYSREHLQAWIAAVPQFHSTTEAQQSQHSGDHD